MYVCMYVCMYICIYVYIYNVSKDIPNDAFRKPSALRRFLRDPTGWHPRIKPQEIQLSSLIHQFIAPLKINLINICFNPIYHLAT